MTEAFQTWERDKRFQMLEKDIEFKQKGGHVHSVTWYGNERNWD